MISYSRQTVSLLDSIKVGWQVWQKSLTQGPKISEFERSVAQEVGARYAVAVSSATAGLHISLLALQIEEGKEVITSPISFLASSNSALYCALKPNFVDIAVNDLNIDVSKVKSEVEKNPNVKVILPVHFAGLPCDMKLISEIAKEKNLYVIEDAAHALGAAYSCGSKVGSCKYSDLTVFSFHPVKSVTTGEGGVITTNSETLYRRLLQLRSHGINQFKEEYTDRIPSQTLGKPNPWYYEMQSLGYHYRLTELQAVLGIAQMKKLKAFIKKRTASAKYYLELLSNSNSISVAQSLKSDANSAWHLFVIRIDFSRVQRSRMEIMELLRAKGIGTQVHYRPIPLQPYYVEKGYKVSDMPNSLKYFEEALSIPLYPNLKRKQQRYIVKTLEKILAGE